MECESQLASFLQLCDLDANCGQWTRRTSSQIILERFRPDRRVPVGIGRSSGCSGLGAMNTEAKGRCALCIVCLRIVWSLSGAWID